MGFSTGRLVEMMWGSRTWSSWTWGSWGNSKTKLMFPSIIGPSFSSWVDEPEMTKRVHEHPGIRAFSLVVWIQIIRVGFSRADIRVNHRFCGFWVRAGLVAVKAAQEIAGPPS